MRPTDLNRLIYWFAEDSQAKTESIDKKFESFGLDLQLKYIHHVIGHSCEL